MSKDLLVTSLPFNRTSRVHFTVYNENGYQFTLPTTRNYWAHWDMAGAGYRLDPDDFA
jgi:hypothetical protein